MYLVYVVMSMKKRYEQIVNGLRKATVSIPRRRIGAETGISPEGLGYWLNRNDANPNINNLIIVEEWLIANGFLLDELDKPRTNSVGQAVAVAPISSDTRSGYERGVGL